MSASTTLVPVQLIAVYDAEKIQGQIVEAVNSYTSDLYDRVDDGLRDGYISGFDEMLKELHVDVVKEPPAEVMNVLRQSAVEYLQKHVLGVLDKIHEATVTAIRQDWPEQQFRAELEKQYQQFRTAIDLIVRTETNKAGNQGRADAAQYAAVRYLQIYTQEDEQVCGQQLVVRGLGPVAGCRDFWDGEHKNTVFRTEDSAGILQLHPRCRCYWAPFQLPARIS